MAWLAQNWIWVLFGVAFVAMHLFGHGGHGGHAGHDSEPTGRGDATNAQTPRGVGVRPASPPAGSGPHHH